MSVRQPFAWAIIKGIKRVENRGENFPDYRGPILIHAAKPPPRSDVKLQDGTPIPNRAMLRLGAIVGAAVIVEMCLLEIAEGVASGKFKVTADDVYTYVTYRRDALAVPKDPEYKKKLTTIARDPFAVGPMCILLASPVEFAEPISWKGQVGLFGVDEAKLGLHRDDQTKLRKLLAKARG